MAPVWMRAAQLPLLTLPVVAGHLSFGGWSWTDWLSGTSDSFLNTPKGEEPAVHSTKPDASKWDSITQLLKGWEFTSNYAISVGTAEHGQLFVYQGGNFTMKTKIPTGSTSKWPSAMMFASLVNDGSIKSLDDPVNKYLSWWTKNASDLRSKVTFRMLLSFTSGFGDGHPGQEMNTRAARQWRQDHGVARTTPAMMKLEHRLSAEIGAAAAQPCNETTGDITECAKSIYSSVKLIGTPGQVYSYNGNHLQLAAAVSLAASGLKDIQEVIKKYLVEPYGMKDSSYLGKCPEFAGSLMTTGEDYEKFLQGVLGYKALTKHIVDASETDATPFLSGYTLYGDYGFGHFLWCFDSVGGMTDACKGERTHVDPGAFGFIPMIDRKRNYYIQVVAAEFPPTGFYPLSGIPEYLAVAIKPHVDSVMTNKHDDAFSHMTHAPGLLSLGVADVNYMVNCKLHPATCA